MSVYFYVNGIPRLVMACAIADEFYADRPKRLILLQQHGYNYDAILPMIRDRFEDIVHLHLPTVKYSDWNHVKQVYFNRYPVLENYFKPGGEVVLFGIGSPLQKHIMRVNRRLGNRIQVFAESLAVDRYFVPSKRNKFHHKLGRVLLPRAFEYQHDYDAFHVHVPQIYASTPYAPKLKPISPLYRSQAFSRYAAQLTAGVSVDGLTDYDTVLFGQPLSNFDNIISREKEEGMLREMLGEQRVLVLPHPNEILGPDNKYNCLKNGRVFRSGVPSELLLLKLRPARTYTYFSTAGVNYAVSNPASQNYFFPIDAARLKMLQRYAPHLPNMHIDPRFSTVLQ